MFFQQSQGGLGASGVVQVFGVGQTPGNGLGQAKAVGFFSITEGPYLP